MKEIKNGSTEAWQDNKISGSGLTVSEQVVDVISERQGEMTEKREEDRKTRN